MTEQQNTAKVLLGELAGQDFVLMGTGIERMVFLNGTRLKDFRLDPKDKDLKKAFNWGFKGKGPDNLAYALLMEIFKNESLVKDVYVAFAGMVLAEINKKTTSIAQPKANNSMGSPIMYDDFKIRLHITKFLEGIIAGDLRPYKYEDLVEVMPLDMEEIKNAVSYHEFTEEEIEMLDELAKKVK